MASFFKSNLIITILIIVSLPYGNHYSVETPVPSVRARFSLILEAYLRCSGRRTLALFRQFQMTRALRQLSQLVTSSSANSSSISHSPNSGYSTTEDFGLPADSFPNTRQPLSTTSPYYMHETALPMATNYVSVDVVDTNMTLMSSSIRSLVTNTEMPRQVCTPARWGLKSCGAGTGTEMGFMPGDIKSSDRMMAINLLRRRLAEPAFNESLSEVPSPLAPEVLLKLTT
ncbi:unnamed protein product [Protopolystoma xenopodis]|uniref:Uncharacterized protein n=1 Tax=Protopolystoma xenopodis TaxID=117903 RepID=A0A448XS26_9PLAT|nr:unnamed protein product [Protopolystoma xenopodis]